MLVGRITRRYLAAVGIIALSMTILAGCGTSSGSATNSGVPDTALPPEAYDTSLSLAKLPAAGYIELGPADAAALNGLGLGGASTLGEEPPFLPFNKYGMYWSERFPVVQGDRVQVKVYSATPVSWFGVDWSDLDLRGVTTTCDVDEDGRTFDPAYPATSSVGTTSTGNALTLTYDVKANTDMVIVVQNANPDRSYRLSMQITDRSHFSVRRFLQSIPLIGNMVKSNSDDSDQ